MRQLVLAAVWVVLPAAVALADSTVVLKDGRRVTGQVMESGESVGVVTDEGLQMFPRSEVASIELDAFGKASPEERAAFRRAEKEALQSSRPAEAVAVWEKYLKELGPQAALRQEAETQLASWHAAAREGKVVWAGKVVTLAERELSKARAGELLSQSVELYGRGEDKKAADALREALSHWPDHPGALFYTALIYQKRQNPSAAAARYYAVLAALPDHVPTLNNLAALECTRRQYRQGVPLIVRAAELAPDAVVVNDNAYRAHLLVEGACDCNYTDEAMKGRLRLMATQAESAMRGQGMARWGTSWVTAETHAQYAAKNQAIEDQLLAMADTVKQLDDEMTVLKARRDELERLRRTAPTAHDLAYDGDGDGFPDRVYPPNVLTRDKVDLMLADCEAMLAVKQRNRTDQIRAAERLRSSRMVPPRDLTFVLVEHPGEELLDGWSADDPETPLLPSLAGPTTAAELIMAIRSGRAVVLADDGTFLGRISSEATDPLGILNAQGPFGGDASGTSLMNGRSPYADAAGDMSVNNVAASRPPRLVYEGRTLAFVTVNPQVRPRVSLADVLAVLRGR
ncbi:MAG TPA: hypothetical protein PLP01_02720 [Phycisphaerae bacterium]|nr:hypothetical protein [Phycisphaerae bacterium]HOI54140.1 hypothetical protein [Phycisphaerae bacterium]